jgi:hypothetical protein
VWYPTVLGTTGAFTHPTFWSLKIKDSISLADTNTQKSSGTSLPDKGKPVVRRGRKATGQAVSLIAGLPKEGRQ